MTTAPVVSWGEAIMTSMAAALALFLGAIPKVIGFLVILLIGWMIATAIAKAVSAILHRASFNGLAERAGLTDFVARMGVEPDSASFLAEIVKWFVRLITLVVAFDALGLPAVSNVLQQILLWLPNLVVALVVLVIAGLAANALHGLVRGAASEAGLSNPDLLATIARGAVWVFGIVVAVDQLNIATALVNTLFTGFVAALALALGLAFGLGGRDTAAEIVRGWYTRSRQAAPRMAQRVEQVQRQTSDGAETAPHLAAPTDAEYEPTARRRSAVRTTKND